MSFITPFDPATGTSVVTTTGSWSSVRDAPPLTTVATYEDECVGRWLVRAPDLTEISSTSATLSDSGDNLWTSCQPFGYRSIYSPGICPSHLTILDITQSMLSSSGSTITRWRGACCPSGMKYETARGNCQGNFTTSLEAFSPVFSEVEYPLVLSGTTYFDTSTRTEYFTPTGSKRLITSQGDVLTMFVNALGPNITTMTSASALAGPLVVLWEEKDMSSFPPAYATSLANRIGISFTPTATPGSSSILTSQTASPQPYVSPSKGLSTGAKTGIGIGSALAFLLVIALIVLIILRKRRKNRKATSSFLHERHHPEMEDQDASLAMRKWFLRGRWRSEVETPKDKPGELDSRSVRVVGGPPQELDAMPNVNRQS